MAVRRETTDEGHEERVVDRSVADRDAGVLAARRRFGGVDVPASLTGMLTALALVVIIGGILAAIIGAIGYQVGLKGTARSLSIGGLVAGLVTLFLAFLFGGWAAGRMARYSGVANGVMTVVWALILGAILAALGAWLGAKYNVFANVNLPNWFSHNAMTVGAIVSGAGALVLMLIGGALGGRWGESYHRRADAYIADAHLAGYTGPAVVRGARDDVVERQVMPARPDGTVVEPAADTEA